MSVHLNERTFQFWLSELGACHDMLDQFEIPRINPDGSRLSISQRLHTLLTHIEPRGNPNDEGEGADAGSAADTRH